MTPGWWSTFLYANGCTGPLSLYASQSLQADHCRPDWRSCGLSTSMRLHATAVGIFVPFAVELVATRTTAVKLRPSSRPTRRLDKSCSPGTVDTVNTTYSTGKLTMSNPVRAYADSRQYTTLERAIKARWLEELWGGVLGAALIASLIALFLSLRSRKSLRPTSTPSSKSKRLQRSTVPMKRQLSNNSSTSNNSITSSISNRCRRRLTAQPN